VNVLFFPPHTAPFLILNHLESPRTRISDLTYTAQLGLQSVATPSVMKNGLSIGAAMRDAPDTVVAESSRGPTSDGRLKPDVVVAGTLRTPWSLYNVHFSGSEMI
jgi:hypothetical protein